MNINSEIEVKNDKLTIHFIQVENFTASLGNYLDEYLMGICRGENHDNELKYIKKQLLNYFSEKNVDFMHGSLGELYSHFYFKINNFNPKFMFLNMEENSAKKGFDGFFEKDDEMWVLDSKSGKFNSVGISHRGKLLEAFRSVNKQISGDSRNNPWENAFQHANSRDVNAEQSLLKTIRNFSNKYIDGVYVPLDTQNLILASTIYWYDAYNTKDFSELLEQLKDIENNFRYKNLILFCCNQRSYEDFLFYLGGDTNGSEREVTTNIS